MRATGWRSGWGMWGGAAMAAVGALMAGGSEVVVVYNTQVPESRQVAMHYAERRGVPTNQVLGFDLPLTETMTRGQFRDRLQRPLLEALEKRSLILLPAGWTWEKVREGPWRPPESARIRYLVPCFGVPVKILREEGLREPEEEKVPPALRRNEAAVDSELALLPMAWQALPLVGPVQNPVYGATNPAQMHPKSGVFMVARLDGPSPAVAMRLVDLALEGERSGLWGRAYFDHRSLAATNSYRVGDDWIRHAAQVSRGVGFETVVDERPETFGAGFPLSHVALYAGWYDALVSGPFLPPKVEFVPGAVAYHLHSFSAQVLRSPDQHWVGPLLARGVTATFGFVEEPYLEATPDLGILFNRLLAAGFSFGEALYAAQPALSWQTTVVGDPLYRPLGREGGEHHLGARLRELHLRLQEAKDPRLEWSHLLVVNFNLAAGQPASEMIQYLEQEPVAAKSAVLQEKLGDLYESQGKLDDAIRAYRRASELLMSPMQRLRVLLVLARNQELFVRPAEAYAVYQTVEKEYPGYADLPVVYGRLAALARELGRPDEASSYEQRLRPPASPR